MADLLTKERRSWNMSRIKSSNTKPEKLVRSLLHRMGYRFRLHGKISKKAYAKGILPGKPDIVLAKYRTVIFIHGCFWHRHEGCSRATQPKTNIEYWYNKLKKNVTSDFINKKLIEDMGWRVLIIWECEIKDRVRLKDILFQELKF